MQKLICVMARLKSAVRRRIHRRKKKNRGNFHHRHGDQAVKWTRGQNRYNNNYQNAKVTTKITIVNNNYNN